jgi:transposase-like protein
VGPIEITVPRDRNGSFEPKVVAERQMRLTRVDEMVISLAARHLTTGRSLHAWPRCMARGGLPPDHLHDHREGRRDILGYGRDCGEGAKYYWLHVLTMLKTGVLLMC